MGAAAMCLGGSWGKPLLSWLVQCGCEMRRQRTWRRLVWQWRPRLEAQGVTHGSSPRCRRRRPLALEMLVPLLAPILRWPWGGVSHLVHLYSLADPVHPPFFSHVDSSLAQDGDDFVMLKLLAKAQPDYFVGSIMAALFDLRFPPLGRCCGAFCKGQRSSG